MPDARSLQSDEKLLKIIEYVGKQHTGVRVTDLEEALDIPLSTIHAHLSTLRECGYVVQDDQQRYSLSLRFLSLGGEVRYRHTLHRQIVPVVKDLADETGESVWYVKEENARMFFVTGCRGENAIRTDVRVGLCTSLLGTAEGRVLLAYLDSERRNKVLRDLRQKPKVKSLDARLKTIRDRGWDAGPSQLDETVTTVAAPVIDNDERLFGAMVLAGPERRFDRKGLTELASLLVSKIGDFNVSLSYQQTGHSIAHEI